MADQTAPHSIVTPAWRILIIDDDEEDFLIARDMLKEAKERIIDVYWAATYEAGQKELLSDNYHAVLVDYHLGLHSGIDLIRSANARGLTAPLILLTGQGSYEVDLEAMRAGASLYLTKGEATPQLLERAIRYAIELKQKERALSESKGIAVLAADRTEAKKDIAADVQDISERKRAEFARFDQETALRQSEAHWRSILESTHDIVFILDRKWRFLYVNRRFAETYHVRQTEYLGRSLWDIYPHYHGTRLEQQYRKAMEERTPVHFEIGGLYSGAWYEVSAYPTQQGISVFAADRTEAKRAQQQLEAAYARLRFYVDANIVGVVLGREDGTLIEVNDYYLNLLGYTRAEFEAGAIDWRLITPPEYLPVDEHAIAELKERGICTPYEKEYLRKDGSRVWVYLSDAVLPDGTLAAFVQDISERKRMEETLRLSEAELRQSEAELRQSEAELRAYSEALKKNEALLRDQYEELTQIYRYAPVGLFTFDRQYRFMRINERMAEINGFPVEHHFDRSMDEIVPDLAGQLKEIFRPVFERGEPVLCVDLHGKTPKDPDKERDWIGNYFPLRSGSGEVVGLIGAVIEVTDRKQVEKDLQHYAHELERSNKALQDFAFVASHDLQEPLRKIIMFSHTLRRHSGEALDQDALIFMDRIQNAAERMQVMINGLLELSRVNTRAVEFTPVNLNEVAEEVVGDLESRIQAVQGQVIVDPLPTMEGDALQLRQLLQNLIGNALKFHKPEAPPIVRVSGTILQQQFMPVVEIRVVDNGIGFDEQYADRIFQPFQRLHSRGTFEGTGLGLAICQKIVERHKGLITVRSAPGEGSAFTIHLPLATSP